MLTQDSPTSSRATRSDSCPRTTTTWSTPDSSAVRTDRRTTVSLPRGSSSLLRPILLDEPAASTTAVTIVCSAPGMKRHLPLPQVTRLAARAHGQQLGDDAERNLLGPVRAEIEADGAEDTAPRR